MNKDDIEEGYEGIPTKRRAEVAQLRQWMKDDGKTFAPKAVWLNLEKIEADEYRRKLMGFQQDLADALDKRYPFLIVKCASRFETQDGDLVQCETYLGERRYLVSSGLVSEHMFHDVPSHRRSRTTETGCSYELCIDDKSAETWNLEIARETLPSDGYGKISYLTKKGLKETRALLQRIFFTKPIDL